MPTATAPDAAPYVDSTLASTSPARPADIAESATTCASAKIADSKRLDLRNYSPIFVPPPTRAAARQGTPERCFVHHAGLMLLLPLVEQVLDLLGSQMRRPMIRQLICQVLSAAVNHEQSKLLEFNSLEYMIGTVVRTIRTQREIADELATPAMMNALIAANFQLTGASAERTFYFDPHTKEYTGILKILKGWCGSVHGIRKALHMDFIHTPQGYPCFVQHFDNFQDPRERFLLCAAKFKKIVGITAPLTWVVDRGFYGQDLLDRLRATGDHLITWEKAYKHDGWDMAAPSYIFTKPRSRNRKDDLQHYQFSYQEQAWADDPTVRRFIVRVQGPSRQREAIEVSILCSNGDLPAEEIIWRMFCRWLQENDFGYLTRHFGLGELTSRAHEAYTDLDEPPPDRMVKSRARKAAAAERQATIGKLGTALVKSRRADHVTATLEQLAEEKLALQAERAHLQELLNSPPLAIGPEFAAWLQKMNAAVHSLKTKIARNKKRTGQRKAQDEQQQVIAALENRVTEIEARLIEIPRRESRLQAMCEDGYVRLETSRKAFMDMIRIICRNIFYTAVQPFRNGYDNYRDDHVRYRALTHAPGQLIRHGNGDLEVCLWPKMTVAPALEGVITAYLAQHSVAVTGTLRASGATTKIKYTIAPLATESDHSGKSKN
ncbi:MAG: hypothetical protein AAB289_02765 [Chloroflexota bacterium]